MRREINYNTLLQLEMEIKGMIENTPALALFLDDKIRRFFARNQVRLQTLHKRYGDIQKKYIVHDEKGQPIRESPSAESSIGEWRFKHREEVNNISDEHETVKQAYYHDAAEFLQITFPLEL
jgi:hypothetical protein